MTRRAWFFIALIALSCFFFFTKSDPSHEERTGRYAHLNTRTDLLSIDPRMMRDHPSMVVAKMLFEGLMRFGPDGMAQPALAEKVEVLDGGKRYQFTLRDALWADGELVTAHDFSYAWSSTLDPAFPAEWSHMLFSLKNARDVKLGKKPVSSLGVRVLSSHLLEVELEHPSPYFLEQCAHPLFFPVPQHVIENDSEWSMHVDERFIGNGPFILDEWRRGERFTMKKNPLFWDADEVHLPGVTLSVVDDEHTELYMFENGELDWAGSPLNSLPPDALEELKEEGQLQITPMAEVYVFKFNTRELPFSNKNIRRAFALAMNRKAIMKNVLQGGQIPATGLVPPWLLEGGQPYFADAAADEARAAFALGLEELEMTAEELPPLTLTYTRSEKHQKVSQALQQQWQEVLGVSLALETFEWNVFLDKLRKHEYQVAGRGWVADTHDPNEFLVVYQYTNEEQGGGNNDTYWADPAYKKLLNRAEKTSGLEARKKLLLEAEKVIVEAMPVAPLMHATLNYVVNPKLHNVVLTDTASLDLRWAYFEEE